MFLRASLILCLLVGILPSAIVDASAQSRLPEFLAKLSPGDLVSGADRFAAPTGNPPVAAVLAGERTVGYAFVNSDWVNSTGYSGKPIEILVGLSTDGKIAGARLMDHHEPIVLIGIPPERIANFIKGYVGRDVLQIATNAPGARPEVDIVSGATVTVTVIAESMVQVRNRVARAERHGGSVRRPQRHAARARSIRRTARPTTGPACSATAQFAGCSLIGGRGQRRFRRAGNNEAAANPEVIGIRPQHSSTSTSPRFRCPRSASGSSAKTDLPHCSEPQARPAGDPGRRQRRLFVQGVGLRARRHFRSLRSASGRRSIRFRDRDHMRVSGRLQVARRARVPGGRSVSRPARARTLDPTEPWRLQLLASAATARATRRS